MPLAPVDEFVSEQAVDDDGVERVMAMLASGWGEAVPPVTVIVYAGKLHVHDGHHRLEAARRLGIDLVPYLNFAAMSRHEKAAHTRKLRKYREQSGHPLRLVRNARGFAWPKGTKVYHATTALRAVSEEGFKTRDELGGRHATGGGPSTSISFTLDKRVAQSICLGLRALALGTRGEIGLGDLIIQARDISPSATDMMIKEKRLTPEVVERLDNGLYGFSWRRMGWRGAFHVELDNEELEEVLASGKAINVEEKFASSGATKPHVIEGWAPAEMLQKYAKYQEPLLLHPWFYDAYNYFLAMGEGDKKVYNPVFFSTSLEAMAAQDVDDIGIIEAEVGADWLCSGYQEAQDLGYDVTGMYGVDMSDWTHSCESHLRDVVEERGYPWRGRPPRREWEEPLPEDTVVYLASGMAELRVYNPQLVTDVRVAENMDDVLFEARDEWNDRGKQVDENALAWPHFRSKTPYVGGGS